LIVWVPCSGEEQGTCLPSDSRFYLTRLRDYFFCFLCTGQCFARLQHELGEGFEGIQIDSSANNPNNISRTAHSVLTLDLVDEEGHPTRAALDRVLDFFREKLT
jgi:hypothetical protein